MRAFLLALVALPPPVHGQSLANVRILAEVTDRQNCDSLTVDIGPGQLRKSLRYHAKRLIKVGLGLSAILRHFYKKDKKLYSVLDSGLGRIYGFAIILLGRLFRYQLYIHHHTAAHTLKPDKIFHLYARLAGQSATHIVLCDRMSQDLKRLYPHVHRVLVVDNATLIQRMNAPIRPQTRDRPLKVGFLANLITEKGVDTAIEIHRRAHQRGIPIELYLAGPVVNAEVEQILTMMDPAQTKTVFVLGPLKGVEKSEFFGAIDVFLFPSRYPYEAQPLVVLEAMSAGLPIIATSCGYVDDLLADSGLDTLGKDQTFLENSLSTIQTLSRNEDQLRTAGKMSQDKFEILLSISAKRVTALCSALEEVAR